MHTHTHTHHICTRLRFLSSDTHAIFADVVQDIKVADAGDVKVVCDDKKAEGGDVTAGSLVFISNFINFSAAPPTPPHTHHGMFELQVYILFSHANIF